MMRTTITIHAGLLKDAKKLAQKSGKTLSALIEEGLHAVLAARPNKSATAKIITYGGSGFAAGINPARLKDLDGKFNATP